MRFLELRVPPPIVALMSAGLMWFLADGTAAADAPSVIRVSLMLFCGLGGLIFNAAGMLSFKRARTTLNPMKPDSASRLVTTGIYRITRNPMYVGGALLLFAWAAYLWSAPTLIGPVVFVSYVTWFQIFPEERVLRAMFGEPYISYCSRVRRWL